MTSGSAGPTTFLTTTLVSRWCRGGYPHQPGPGQPDQGSRATGPALFGCRRRIVYEYQPLAGIGQGQRQPDHDDPGQIVVLNRCGQPR
jgi:hypothetical protein